MPTLEFHCQLCTCETMSYRDGGRYENLRGLNFFNSTQYKTLAPNALRFTYQNLKFCKPHEKTKNIKMLNLLVKN